MDKLFSLLLSLYELIFPKDEQLLLCKQIKSAHLQQLVNRTFTDTQPSFFAPFPYKHRYVYTLIRTAKYYGYIHAPVVLGQALAPFLSEEIAEKNMYEEYLKPVLIPIPLHRKKYRERGYNQVERIAQALINAMESKNVTLDTSTLIRIKNTPSQAHQKSKTARVKNMHQAFTVTKNIKGMDIILLDDVVTTGATLQSAKRVLVQAGAKNVLCVAVAH